MITLPQPDAGGPIDPAAAAVSGHVRLGTGRWYLWPQVAVRSAGFPAAVVTRLASPALGRAADAMIQYAAGSHQDAEYREQYANALAQTEAHLRELAGSSRLRTALAWQNHRVFATAIDPLLRRRPGMDARNSAHRQHEELIAGYVQRYCTKNDSIGHFGPVGWAPLDAGGFTTFTPSPVLIASHEVFFEGWAIDRVAAVLADDPAMAAWLAPRRVPHLKVADDTILLAGRPAIAVDPVTAHVLRCCDGRTPAIRLATDLVRSGHADSVDGVYATLHDLVKRRWIVWTAEVPIDPRPDRALRALLEGVGDPVLRAGALAVLARLETARDAIDAVWTDADRLVPAMHELDDVFVDIAGTPPSRNPGKMYAGRTLVYHDSRRALDLRLGAEVRAALEPLELLLDSAAWFTYTVGEAINARINELYQGLQRRLRRPVDLASLWFECMTLVRGTGPKIVAEVAGDLRAKWAQVLRVPLDVARVRYRSADLAAAVRETFPAPHAGWDGARLVSPDVMLTASSVDAIRRGDFEVVLAETHLALASYRHSCFVTQHPAPAELRACLDRTYPAARLLQMLPKENSARLTARTQPALKRDDDYLVALTHYTADPARPRLLNGADLIVEQAGDRLAVRVPAGECFDVLDAFSELMLDLMIDAFDVFSGAEPHLPRITVDRLVVQRECWRFAATTLGFLHERDPALRYWRARRWARDAGLPTRVFVTSPVETKPFFLDFDSPIYVDIFCKAARRVQAAESTSLITLTEMLPALDQLWLVDADGETYTSELRMVAVDPRPVRPYLPTS